VVSIARFFFVGRRGGEVVISSIFFNENISKRNSGKYYSIGTEKAMAKIVRNDSWATATIMLKIDKNK
jgi:hypothetical protein